MAANHTKAECQHYHVGTFYNWPAAIAVNADTYPTSLDSENAVAQNSICPAGWKLPTGVRNESKTYAGASDFDRLFYAMGFYETYHNKEDSWEYISDTEGYAIARTAPLYLIRGGYIGDYISGQGDTGYYWTNTAGYNYDNDIKAQRLAVLSSVLGPGEQDWRERGMFIRCVARQIPCYNKTMKQVILKVKLKDPDAFEQKLSDIDYDFSPVYWQHDRVYVPRGFKHATNLPRLTMRTEMRAIDEPAHYYLMLRRHIEDSGVDVVEKTTITDYENMVNIILQLGFKPIGEAARRRQEIDMGDGTFIYLDRVDGEETSTAYAKIESILKDGESASEAYEDLKKTFATFGETDIIETPYGEQ